MDRTYSDVGCPGDEATWQTGVLVLGMAVWGMNREDVTSKVASGRRPGTIRVLSREDGVHGPRGMRGMAMRR